MYVVYDPEKPHLGGNIKGGDANTFCPAVWDRLIEAFKPETICDVGCGEGYLMEYFHNKGIYVWGYDGLPENKLNAPIAVRENIFVHDFQNRLGSADHFDMVLSCEFVEHVSEDYCINYLEQFKNCKILAFTHAVPDQGGHHHVNCRDDNYWIRTVEALGMIWLPEETAIIRSLAGETYWTTTLVFKTLKQ